MLTLARVWVCDARSARCVSSIRATLCDATTPVHPGVRTRLEVRDRHKGPAPPGVRVKWSTCVTEAARACFPIRSNPVAQSPLATFPRHLGSPAAYCHLPYTRTERGWRVRLPLSIPYPTKPQLLLPCQGQAQGKRMHCQPRHLPHPPTHPPRCTQRTSPRRWLSMLPHPSSRARASSRRNDSIAMARTRTRRVYAHVTRRGDHEARRSSFPPCRTCPLHRDLFRIRAYVDGTQRIATQRGRGAPDHVSSNTGPLIEIGAFRYMHLSPAEGASTAARFISWEHARYVKKTCKT